MLKMKNRNFKRCLITGIYGSGGSYLAEYILKKNKKIKIFGNYRNKNSNLDKVKTKINTIKCDLNNFKQTQKLIKITRPDVIFHLASNADVRLSFDNPREIINNNNNCTLNLLEAVRLSKFNPVIQICSTSEVYGQVKKKDLPIKENCSLNPASPYAVSKTFQDLLAQNYYKNYGLKIIITRMFTYLNARRFNLFASHWALQIAQIEAKQKKYLEHGNLNSIRTIIDQRDAVSAYYQAATKGKIGEIYNICGEKIVKIKNFLKVLCKKSRANIICKVNTKLYRKNDVTLQIPNCLKFKKHTGWKANIPIEDSIDDLLLQCRKIVNGN